MKGSTQLGVNLCRVHLLVADICVIAQVHQGCNLETGCTGVTGESFGWQMLMVCYEILVWLCARPSLIIRKVILQIKNTHSIVEAEMDILPKLHL